VVRAGENVVLNGQSLSEVKRITVDGLEVSFTVRADGTISMTLPTSLKVGVYDLVIFGDFGRVTVQGLFTVLQEAQAAGNNGWTKMRADGRSVNMYYKNVVGVGKVQFKVNGREIAWVRAVDETDPKIRFRNNTHYLVRTVQLQQGKNALEIYVEGKRVWRAAYWIPRSTSASRG
jgi:hypothetical protein